MRVLHIHSGNLYGGIESMLRTLVAHRGAAPAMEPRFALAFAGRPAQELQEAGAQCDLLGDVRFSRPWTTWRARRRLAALVAADQPDVCVVHSDWSHALAAPVVRRAGRPLVRWYHAPPKGRGAHWLERLARRSPANFVVCNSDYTASGLTHRELLLPRVTIRPPAPAPSPAPPQARREVRAALGARDDQVVILQVGRFEPGKGHATLFQALALLADRSDWVVWQVGGAQRDEELRYLGALSIVAARLGLGHRVKFLGERADTRSIYAAADLYCQPNATPDSYGLTFIEALYAGLPVVTSRLGGAIEIVDSSCGELVPPNDPAVLADALRRLVADGATRRALGAAGPARARTLSDADARIAELGRQLAAWIGH